MTSPETFTVIAAVSPDASVWPLVLEFQKFEDETVYKGPHGEPHLPPPPTNVAILETLHDGSTELNIANPVIPTLTVMTGSVEDANRMDVEIRVARTLRKIRGTADHFQHFHSSGVDPLPRPPDLASQNWHQEPCDVYSHHIEGAKVPQLWVWLSNATAYGWLSVEEGFICPTGKVTQKILVLPEKFGVSWVAPKTLQRSYPHLLDKVVNLALGS